MPKSIPALLCCLALALSACTAPSQTYKAAPNADRVRAQGGLEALALGHDRMAAGEYSNALSYYNQAAAKLGATPTTISAIGTARLMLGQLENAEKLFRLTIDKDPNYASAWNNLGVILASKGELQEAYRVFKVAFALTRGASEEIKKNLTLILTKIEDSAYTGTTTTSEFELVREENGKFSLVRTPTEQ